MRKQYTQNIKSMVVKVGTSVLTKGGFFDKSMILRLSSEFSRFLKKGVHVYVVSSGAIGSGMTILKIKKRPTQMCELQASAAVGQRYLMQCYEEAFSRYGFSTAQVLLTWEDLARRERFLNAKHTLHQIQAWGLVPIINENDTVATDEIRFGDNDRLSALLAILVQADVLVILSATNGLYADGKKHEHKSRIPVVQKVGHSVFRHVKERKNSFTVGGMRSKLSSVSVCTRAGIPVFLADGRERDVLTHIFNAQDVGTLFVPESVTASRKNWIRTFTDLVAARRKRSA